MILNCISHTIFSRVIIYNYVKYHLMQSLLSILQNCYLHFRDEAEADWLRHFSKKNTQVISRGARPQISFQKSRQTLLSVHHGALARDLPKLHKNISSEGEMKKYPYAVKWNQLPTKIFTVMSNQYDYWHITEVSEKGLLIIKRKLTQITWPYYTHAQHIHTQVENLKKVRLKPSKRIIIKQDMFCYFSNSLIALLMDRNKSGPCVKYCRSADGYIELDNTIWWH